jgi:chromate reductase
MAEHRLLGICGALRAASTNRLLLGEAMRLYGPATWQTADLRLPLFDEDLEIAAGIPAEVQRLADQVAAADAVFIATPEYNKSLPGVLKNALDWVSRTTGSPFKGKPVAIASAADGRAGGDRSQFALRLALIAFLPRVVTGPEVMVGNSRAAFGPDGRLLDARYVRALGGLCGELRAEVERGRLPDAHQP